LTESCQQKLHPTKSIRLQMVNDHQGRQPQKLPNTRQMTRITRGWCSHPQAKRRSGPAHATR
ncbi:hypothetical protein H4R20_006774, partial [Coemansia guatemalensis]